MKIEIVRGPDKNDPFNQFITVIARETVNGKTYGVAERVSDYNMASTRNLVDLFAEVGRKIEGHFRARPETSMVADRVTEAMATALFKDYNLGDTITWNRFHGAVEMVKETEKEPEMILPKELLSELETMDEGRMKEILSMPGNMPLTPSEINDMALRLAGANLGALHGGIGLGLGQAQSLNQFANQMQSNQFASSFQSGTGRRSW